MKNNTRTKLFLLKQFGFSEKLLESIFVSSFEPINAIFNILGQEYEIIKKFFSNKDEKLSFMHKEFVIFSTDLIKNDKFIKDKVNNKILFKYDDNEISKLIPEINLPLFMYSKGDLKLIGEDRKRIAVVGTRAPNLESIKNAENLTKFFLNKGYIIVSGLAEGIDTVSHNIALETHGSTIAILPTSFNKVYPKSNELLAKEIEKKGLLLSSIGPYENTYKSSFLERNKYVAGVSDLLLVIETNLKSGTMNTIRNASEAGKRILFIDQKNDEINAKIKKYGGEMIDIE